MQIGNNCLVILCVCRNAVDGQLGPKHERLPILHHVREMRLSRREARGVRYVLAIAWIVHRGALVVFASVRRAAARGAAGAQEDRERTHRAEQQAAPSDCHHAMR